MTEKWNPPQNQILYLSFQSGQLRHANVSSVLVTALNRHRPSIPLRFSSISLPSANEVARKGNVFTSVCQEICPVTTSRFLCFRITGSDVEKFAYNEHLHIKSSFLRISYDVFTLLGTETGTEPGTNRLYETVCRLSYYT